VKYVHEPQENIKMFKKFVVAELIQIFLCAYCYLYLTAKSITHTENVIINADDLLCLQLHTLRQVHPTFYGVRQILAKVCLLADNMNSVHRTKDD
jgi:sugar phosphate permease